ncbi:MAG: serine O-acetyltransferase [Polyangiaceae bacterium]|nr:serine O-acetyltransferase [Polyangiaceae bacterium]
MVFFKLAFGWLKKIPGAMVRVREDIRAVRKNDPAARSSIEVALLYPGVHAIWMHRVAHDLWTRGASLSARAVSQANRFLTGIEIHPGATLGRRVFIDHGMGVVIGETATVGDDCLIYKGVVLGGVSLDRVVRHPQLASGVVVGSNACILGAIAIGEHARIGSGSVVVKPVPAGATVVGVPGRVIVPVKQRFDAALDHANLPDPTLEMVRALVAQNDKLRDRVLRLEAKLGIVHDDDGEPKHLPFEGDELPASHGG